MNSKRLKPLEHIAGRPIVAWVIDELCRNGVQKVILLGGHQSGQLAELARFRAACWKSAELIVAKSAPIAETFGRLKSGLDFLEGSKFVLTYGDSLVFYEDSADPFVNVGCGTLGITVFERKVDYGVIEIDDGSGAPRFIEKPSYLANAGNYVLDKAFLSPDAASSSDSFEQVVLPRLISKVPLQVCKAAAWVPIDRLSDLQKGEACLKHFGRL